MTELHNKECSHIQFEESLTKDLYSTLVEDQVTIFFMSIRGNKIGTIENNKANSALAICLVSTIVCIIVNDIVR